MLEKYPFYAPFTTSDDQYNVGHKITSASVMAILVARDDVPADEIYNITKAIYENLDELKSLNSKANYMSLDGAFRGIAGNVHPGAAKYYKEQGMDVPDNNL